MTSQELAAANYAGNDVAMQWYLATHPENRYPAAGELVAAPTNGGYRVGVGPGALLLLGLGLVAVVFLLKQ